MATLLYTESNEVKASGIELRDSFAEYNAAEMMASYDEDGVDTLNDNSIHNELELDGLVGMKKIDEKTLKLSFNDGDIIRVNIKPSKMASVMDQIRSKSVRHSNKRIIGY